jgi:hypothetical protein
LFFPLLSPLQKAEHVLLFQSPAEVIDYAKDEYVPPVVEDKKAPAKKGPASRFQQQEEEEEEEVSTRKVKEIAPELAVVQNFQAWETIVNDRASFYFFAFTG